MRKLKIVEHMSLDGVIQVSNWPGEKTFPYNDWTASYRTPTGLSTILGLYGDEFDLLLGRRTYDAKSAYWPAAPQSPMADRLNAATKHVVTHRPESLEWGPAASAGPDLVEAVRRLKADGDRDLILSGSGSLTSTLLEHGLADELIVIVYPVLLGTAKRLFKEGTGAQTFRLEATLTLPTGVMVTTYSRSGALPPHA